jgi:hypothetical protein
LENFQRCNALLRVAISRLSVALTATTSTAAQDKKITRERDELSRRFDKPA